MLRMWYKAQFTERSDQGLRQESSEQPPFGVGEAKIKSMDLAAGTAIENIKWQADDRAPMSGNDFIEQTEMMRPKQPDFLYAILRGGSVHPAQCFHELTFAY